MRLETLLVVEGNVMIPQTETPALSISDDGWIPEIDQIVNFLRSGCPSVQLRIPPDWMERRIKGVHDFIQNELGLLSKPGEFFEMRCSALDEKGRIITITRTVVPKTEKVAFKTLAKGNEAVVHGCRCMAVIHESDSALSGVVPLEGSQRGIIITLNETDIVQKIIG